MYRAPLNHTERVLSARAKRKEHQERDSPIQGISRKKAEAFPIVFCDRWKHLFICGNHWKTGALVYVSIIYRPRARSGKYRKTWHLIFKMGRSAVCRFLMLGKTFDAVKLRSYSTARATNCCFEVHFIDIMSGSIPWQPQHTSRCYLWDRILKTKVMTSPCSYACNNSLGALWGLRSLFRVYPTD